MLTDSLKNIADNFDRMKIDLPLVLGNEGQNFFRQSFERQEFVDQSPEKWQQVQRRIPGTPEYKYPKTKQLSRRTSAILVRTGKLRQSVNNSLKEHTWEGGIVFHVVALGSKGKDYSSVHNYGLVMKNGSRMPQRKFIGHSHVLIERLSGKIQSALKRLHNNRA